MIKLKHALFGSVLTGACLVGLLYTPVNAVAGGVSGWRVKGEVETAVKYDTNIYKKSSAQIDRYDTNNPNDVTSGRFTKMESMSDLIITPAVAVSLKGKGIIGKNLTIKPAAEYNLYTQNTEKNYAQFFLDIKQALGGKSYVKVGVDYAPNVYSKNYLSDAVDGADAGNDISSAEKIYKSAYYDNFTVTGSYGKRLWKGKKRGNGKLGALGINSVDGEVLAGYSRKEYETPFANRNEKSFLLGASVDMVVDKTVDITLEYLFESIDTPSGTEVLVRDETYFGADLNGDSDLTDTAARTVQAVDRSRTEHTVAFKAATKIGNGWNGSFKYDLRLQNYSSEEVYDITRIDRKDVRHRVGVGVDRKFGKNLSLGFGWRWTKEDAGRAALAAIADKTEGKSYVKHELSAVLAYNF